jgi:hypothetical protein
LSSSVVDDSGSPLLPPVSAAAHSSSSTLVHVQGSSTGSDGEKMKTNKKKSTKLGISKLDGSHAQFVNLITFVAFGSFLKSVRSEASMSIDGSDGGSDLDDNGSDQSTSQAPCARQPGAGIEGLNRLAGMLTIQVTWPSKPHSLQLHLNSGPKQSSTRPTGAVEVVRRRKCRSHS